MPRDHATLATRGGGVGGGPKPGRANCSGLLGGAKAMIRALVAEAPCLILAAQDFKARHVDPIATIVRLAFA